MTVPPTGYPLQVEGQGRTGRTLGYSLPARTTALVLGAAGAVGLVVAAVWPVHSVDSGQPTCLLRLAVGLPCPACGMTRAWVHAVHGDLVGAFWLNPFGLVLLAMAAFAAGYVALALVRRRPPERLLDLVRPTPALILFSVWIAWSFYRMWSVSHGQEVWASVMG